MEPSNETENAWRKKLRAASSPEELYGLFAARSDLALNGIVQNPVEVGWLSENLLIETAREDRYFRAEVLGMCRYRLAEEALDLEVERMTEWTRIRAVLNLIRALGLSELARDLLRWFGRNWSRVLASRPEELASEFWRRNIGEIQRYRPAGGGPCRLPYHLSFTNPAPLGRLALQGLYEFRGAAGVTDLVFWRFVFLNGAPTWKGTALRGLAFHDPKEAAGQLLHIHQALWRISRTEVGRVLQVLWDEPSCRPFFVSHLRTCLRRREAWVPTLLECLRAVLAEEERTEFDIVLKGGAYL